MPTTWYWAWRLVVGGSYYLVGLNAGIERTLCYGFAISKTFAAVVAHK
jgi:hypothetical protein